MIGAFSADPDAFVGPKRKDAAAAALVLLTGAIEQPHPHLGLERVPVPTTTRFWEDWWTENGARFDPKLRYRHGRIYTPLMAIDELEHVEALQRDRVLGALELAMVPNTPRVRVGDFVALQRTQLRQARAAIEADLASDSPTHPAGAWTAQHLG